MINPHPPHMNLQPDLKDGEEPEFGSFWRRPNQFNVVSFDLENSHNTSFDAIEPESVYDISPSVPNPDSLPIIGERFGDWMSFGTPFEEEGESEDDSFLPMQIQQDHEQQRQDKLRKQLRKSLPLTNDPELMQIFEKLIIPQYQISKKRAKTKSSSSTTADNTENEHLILVSERNSSVLVIPSAKLNNTATH